MDTVVIGAILALAFTIIIFTFVAFKVSNLIKNSHSEN